MYKIAFNQKIMSLGAFFLVLVLTNGCEHAHGLKMSNIDQKEFLQQEKEYYERIEPEHRYIFRTTMGLLADNANIEPLIDEVVRGTDSALREHVLFIHAEASFSQVIVGAIDSNGVGTMLRANIDGVKRSSIPPGDVALSINKNPCFLFVDEQTVNSQLDSFAHGSVLFLSKKNGPDTKIRSAAYGLEFMNFSNDIGVSPSPSLYLAAACHDYLGL